MEVAASGDGARPDRENGVPEFELVVSEDAVRVEGYIGVQLFQEVSVECLRLPREKSVGA